MEFYCHTALILLLNERGLNQTEIQWRTSRGQRKNCFQEYHNVSLLFVAAKSDQHPATEVGSVGSHKQLLRLFPGRDRIQGARLRHNVQNQ